jgi:hypothetical protein
VAAEFLAATHKVFSFILGVWFNSLVRIGGFCQCGICIAQNSEWKQKYKDASGFLIQHWYFMIQMNFRLRTAIFTLIILWICIFDVFKASNLRDFKS